MKQYNRIMLGEHGKFLNECLEGGYIGTGFLPAVDLSSVDHSDERKWRDAMIARYLETYPDKTTGTARTCTGFLWTVCYGLQQGDVVLASNGEGSYRVGIVDGDYYYQPDGNLPHRRAVKWLDKKIERKQMSQSLQNSSGSIGTCCNITKYASELETLIGGEAAQPAAPVVQPLKENYKERDLHRLLSNFLSSKRNILSKTIFHETSKKCDQNQKWIHPDMIGVSFSEFSDKATVDLMKAADIKQYVDLYSFELKCSLQSDHALKEAFFQALSNSSWANFGYLVAFEVNDDLLEEMERLNRAFGIGIIRLSPYDTDTRILFPARKNEVDYYTVDKLCRINLDFKKFMERTARVLNAQSDMLEDVRRGLEQFCDKTFDSEAELLQYCTEKNIPLSN
ncbi:MAG: hypothetical protein K2L21_01430 [Muribaculaceae bacterium]|nr:hypothetical protein [Muribaculaceae bacterium]